MNLKESDRLQSRVLAIDIRLHELNQELHRTQLRVNLLEARLEDARLASMMEDAAIDPGLAPELEGARKTLEHQQALVAEVKKNQWKARVAYTMTRANERKSEREQQGAAEME